MNAPPPVGLGLWKVENDRAPGLIVEAVERGYRHLDSACDYGNETEVGQGISKCLEKGIVARNDLWITSKLWNTFHRPEHVRSACERSIRDLQVDYLDLYLIHFPISQAYVAPEVRYPPGWFFEPDARPPRMKIDPVPILDTWRAMEELVDAGLVRQIGVSNFGVSLIRDLLASARIRPSVLQIESHPYLTQEKLIRFCQIERMAITAFSPLGAPSYVPLGMAKAEDSVLKEPIVQSIAKQKSVTPAQIVLRWGVQRGTSIIPKTSNPERLSENIDLFDFELTQEEMQLISRLNRNQRFNDPGVFCEPAFNRFCPIYE